MTAPIPKTALIRPTDDQVSCNMQGQSLLLQVSRGHYFGLNEVGSFIWERIQTGPTFEQLIGAVAGRYEVEREQAEVDTQALLVELQAEGLIQISDAIAS